MSSFSFLHRSRQVRCTLFGLLVATFLLVPAAQADTITWTGSGDGSSWNDAANWSPATVPGADDDVLITNDGTYTVVLNVNATVNSLTLGGETGTQTLQTGIRTLTMNAASTIGPNGVVEWTGGTIAGGPLTNEGLMLLTGTATNMILGAGTLVNTGTLRWTSGLLYLSTNATLDNRATFDLAADVDLRRTGAAPHTLVNTGTLVKTAGAAEGESTFLDVPVINDDGTIQVDQGTLQLTEGGTYTDGTYTTAEGATLAFNSGTHTISGTLTGTPAGTVTFQGATMAAGPDGATLNFDGTGFDWQGNTLTAGLDQTVTNTGLLTLTGTVTNMILGAGTLVNTGTLRWTSGLLYLSTNATLDNRATFDLAADVDLRRTGAAPHTLVNTGTLVKTAGAAEDENTFLDVPVVNDDGTIQVDQGTLQLTEGGTYTDGTYTAAEGATLAFNSGTHTISGTLTGTPAGTVTFQGATMAAGPDGATLNFDGTGFDWQGNTLTAGLDQTVTNTGLLTLTGTVTNMILGAGTLVNTGTLRWTSGLLYLSTNATLDNRATFDLAADVDLRRTGAAPQTLVNSNTGTLVKTAGAAEDENTFLDVPVINDDGTIQVDEGTLQLTEGGTYTDGTYTAAEGATLAFNSGTHTISGTLTGTPAGTVTFQGATMAAGPDGATLNFDGTGFDWQGNTLTAGLDQTVTNTGLLTLTGTVTNMILGAGTLVNTGTLRWTSGLLYLSTNATLDNRATFDLAADVDLRRTGAAPQTLVNSNTGTLVKTAGAAEGESTFLDVPVINDDGTIQVDEGTLQLTEGGTYTDGRYEPAAGAMLQFNGGTHTLSGMFEEELAGRVQLAGSTTLAIGADGATFDFTGNGFEWLAGTIGGEGTLRNLGQITLTSNSSKTLSADSLRNEGTVSVEGGFLTLNETVLQNNAPMTWAGSGLTVRQSTVHNTDALTWQAGNVSLVESTLRNAGVLDLQGDFSLSGSPADTFAVVNQEGGLFRKSSGDGTATVSAPVRNQTGAIFEVASGTWRFTNLVDHQPGAILQGAAAFDFATATVSNNGLVLPGASPGQLTYVGTYAPAAPTTAPEVDVSGTALEAGYDLATARSSSGATLQVELGGTSPGVDYDVLAIEQTTYRIGFRFIGGDAVLGGALDVQLLDGFTPQAEDSFTVLIAPEGLSGGFASRTGLVQDGLALYPTFGDTTVTLTAVQGVPTISGTIAAAPSNVVGDRMQTVQVTGTGFGPDVDVRLVCTDCQGAEGDVPGLVGTITPTAMTVAFDLRDGSRLGTYDLVVTDPRGGEARVPFSVTPGPYVVSLEATDAEASEDGRDPAAFLIRVNRPVLEALTIPIRFRGTATPVADYTTSTIGQAVIIPRNQQEATLRIFPLNDSEEESEESVTLQLLEDERYILQGSFATVRLADGPPQTTFAIFGVSPERGGTTGLVSVSLSGQAFTPGATLRLTRGGETLVGANPELLPESTGLRATFDLRGQPEGRWTVDVTNGDGATATLPEAFTVESGAVHQVWGTLIAPPRYRAGRAVTFTLTYGNTGNVDAPGAAFFIGGIPASASVSLGEAFTRPDAYRTLVPGGPLISRGDDELTIPFVTDAIAPGETRTATFTVEGGGDMEATLYTMSLPTTEMTRLVAETATTQRSAQPTQTPARTAAALSTRRTNTQVYDWPPEDVSGLKVIYENLEGSYDRDFWAPRAWEFAESAVDVVRGTGGFEGACVGAAESVYNDHVGLTEPGGPLEGWEIQQVYTGQDVNKAGIVGHVSNVFISPSGNVYLGDNYVYPGLTPMEAVEGGYRPADAGFIEGLLNPAVWVGGGLAVTKGQLDVLWEPANPNFSTLCRDKGCFAEPEKKKERKVDEVASFDPNDKLGSPGYGDGRHITLDEPLSYTIRFENLPAATAPAAEVAVIDQLDLSVFDPASFTLNAITFGDTRVEVPPGLARYSTRVDLRPTENLLVQIDASLDPTSGELVWRFTSLDPETGLLPEDPLVGFLPPNKIAPEGEGSVSFTIRPWSDLTTGTEIRNEARIYFDLNEPIDTPPWINTVDLSAPQSAVSSLTAVQGDSSFTVQWQGSDDGAGVTSYSVFVSTNGGPFIRWISHTPQTSAVFNGRPDDTYAFYSIAHDGTGNVEAPKTEADASTTVVVANEDEPAADLPATYALRQNYPNPFNPATTIAFDLPEPTHVRLTVFDMLGRQVALLVDEDRSAGRFQIDWHAGTLPSGTYVYRIDTDGFTATRLLTLIK